MAATKTSQARNRRTPDPSIKAHSVPMQRLADDLLKLAMEHAERNSAKLRAVVRRAVGRKK